jgi:hypothetical protein
VEDIIDFIRESSVHLIGFWVNRFAEQNADTAILRQAISLEQDRHSVNSGDLKRYFDCVTDHVGMVHSPFVWSTNKTRAKPLA